MNLINQFFNGKSSQNTDYSECIVACYDAFYERLKAFNRKNYPASFEDLTQETFMKFLEALQKGAEMDFQEEEDILKYLITISKRLILNLIKKKDNQTFEVIENLDSDSEEFSINPFKAMELQEDFERIAKHISSKDWEILQLKVSGFKYSEIAEQLDMKEDSIKKSVYRIKKKLKTIFKE